MIAVHHRLARIFEPAVLDDRDLEGRAPHVGSDHVLIAENAGEILCPHHACGRSALDHADRTGGGLGDRNEAAVALHDQHRATIAGVREQLGQLRQIGLGDATHIGIDHGC